MHTQLSVTLPSELAATISSSTSAELELWAGGKLACSSTVLLVPASRAQVAVELALWTQVSKDKGFVFACVTSRAIAAAELEM